MAADMKNEDYPAEIDEQLTGFDSSASAVKTMLDKLISMPRNELLQKVDWRHGHGRYLSTQNNLIKQTDTATPTQKNNICIIINTNIELSLGVLEWSF